MKAKEDHSLAEWLRKKDNVYTSPEIQNEVIKQMGIKLLQNMATEFHFQSYRASPFLTIMADETTDASNQEQVTLFVHWSNDDLYVGTRRFLGLYSVPSIDLDMLVTVIKDVF